MNESCPSRRLSANKWPLITRRLPSLTYTELLIPAQRFPARRRPTRFTSVANFNMTLYNFGKREANVQASRETLGAVQQDYATTTQDIVLSIKQAYYVYLGAQALVKVRQETVRSRELLVRQATGFFEVGTRAKIDVARAEANLYTAQADLIATENAVKVAWVTLRNAMGSPRLPEQPVAEDSPEVEFSINLAGARNVAFDTRTELKSFEAQRKASDQLIAAARRGHLPDLIFDSSYGRRHISNEVQGRTGGPTPSSQHLSVAARLVRSVKP